MDKSVKILLISSGDTNGAYEAIYRMAKQLHLEGHKVKMMVKHKTRNDEFIVEYVNYSENELLKKYVFWALKIIQPLSTGLKSFFKVKYHNDYSFLSKNESTKNVSCKNIFRQIGFIPDIIYVGMTNDFVNSTDLLAIKKKSNARLFCLAVDMNHFTGGCHYAWNCNGYISGCTDNCPAILSKKDKKIAKKNFDIKMQNALSGEFQIIGMSEWTINQAKKSKIYKNQQKIINLNSLVDTSIFNDQSKKIAKQIFKLDRKKFYVLLGSQDINDKRKGMEFSINALNLLYDNLTEYQRLNIEIIIVSRSDIDNFTQLKFKKKYIDYIKDYRLLSLLYQASDVFVNSSIEDSGPMMVSEALACGTPVVGFNMGVISNMVISGFNGYKAILKDSYDLYKGIETIYLLPHDQYDLHSKNAVLQVQKYSALTKLGEKLNIVSENR